MRARTDERSATMISGRAAVRMWEASSLSVTLRTSCSQVSIAQGSDCDLLREMIAFVASRMTGVEVESLTGAGHGEQSAERSTHRNGYRTRDWHTGAGTVPVAIPKLRKGSYLPSFLEPRRSADKALIAVIQEAHSSEPAAYVHGVSTRSVDNLVKAMGDVRVRRR